MDAFEREIKTDFLTEAKDLLSGTEQCFLSLEKNPSDLENLNLIFRLAHNLKGSSGAVGFSELADFTHKLESLLLALKEQRILVSPKIVELLLRSNDYLSQTIETLRGDLTASYNNRELATELCDALTNPSYHEVPGPQAATVADQIESVEPRLMSPKCAEAPTSQPQVRKDENIRVSLSRIEKLLNNVGELSILQAVMVQQSTERGTVISPLMRETLSSMSKIIRETQNLSMGLRMMPIKQMFQKMQRIVRDTSKSLGKEVELHLAGEETEIDKTVLEQLGDPLVHIVRNAVDHGLESNEERLAAGKSAVGNVYLSASHRAGHVMIEVREDGKGLDPNKLTEKAKAKGLISPDTKLSPEQAYKLIFLPGFSTKEQVTDVSGRGVGMDVVKTNISSLQGRVEIETDLGKGTSFQIFLPLTLAIIDSIVVQVDDNRFVVPLNQVSEFFRPQESDITNVYGRHELVTLRDEHLPTFSLSSLMKRETETKPTWMQTALVIREGSGNFAVNVDRVIAQQQVVIKPLGAELKGKTGIMGSAILGDGRPALILDLFELTKAVRGEVNIRH